MKIAIASGKGGTGKTTVSTNLAAIAARSGETVYLVDCDVEEPNCHLFMQPSLERKSTITLTVPRILEDICTGCGDCAKVCQFHALACIQKRVVTFPDLCHGCGACTIACPENAIADGFREIGVVEEGTSNHGNFMHGRMRIGEPMSKPLIHALKERTTTNGLTILDCPPGSSCPVIEAVSGVDYVVLVAEPTPFGLSDMEIVVELLRVLDLPFGVVVNRSQGADDVISKYCAIHDIPILLRIPEARRIAEISSNGCLAIDEIDGVDALFVRLLSAIHGKIEEMTVQ